jgi:hypothetical protein
MRTAVISCDSCKQKITNEDTCHEITIYSLIILTGILRNNPMGHDDKGVGTHDHHLLRGRKLISFQAELCQQCTNNLVKTFDLKSIPGT